MNRSYACMPSLGSSFRAIDREEPVDVVSTRVLRLYRRNNRTQSLTLVRTPDLEAKALTSKCASVTGYGPGVGARARPRRVQAPKLGR